MKKYTVALFAVALLACMPAPAEAQTQYSYFNNEHELIAFLQQIIADLQAEIRDYNNRGSRIIYGGGGSRFGGYYGKREVEVVGKPRSKGRSNDDEPEAITRSARDIDENSAELRGEVDMNDFNNGEVFFVYGEDEDQVEDVADDYDSYSDVDEDGDDLQKSRVDFDLDGDETYEDVVSGLDEDTDYFFSICVGYEDDDDDDVLECGDVEEFTTDGDNRNRNDEPVAITDDAENVEDDSAELHGEVDMNDFDNGLVFFVYGEDEGQIEDVEDDYDTYSDIDEDGDDLQKIRIDSSLDGFRRYWEEVFGLDDDTDHFFQICVEYEDDDNDDVLECGGVEEFTTDN